MKIALVDDNQEELGMLLQMVGKHLDSIGNREIQVEAFYSGKDFFAVWETGKYQMVFLDIYLKDWLGIDIARKIRETDREVYLVFCTSSNGFASESYEVNARDYLLKPFSEQKVIKLLHQMRIHWEEGKGSQVTLPDGQDVLLRNIIYTEYSNHIVTFHNKVGKNDRTRISHAKLEEILCSVPYFLCCFKGIIVNFYEVCDYNKDVLIMSDGSRVPVSRRKAKEVGDAWVKFCFEQMRKEINR